MEHPEADGDERRTRREMIIAVVRSVCTGFVEAVVKHFLDELGH